MARKQEEFGTPRSWETDVAVHGFDERDTRGMDDRPDGLGKAMFNFDDDKPAMVSIAREKTDDQQTGYRDAPLNRREAVNFAERKFDETLDDLPAVRKPDLEHMLTRMVVLEGNTWEKMDTEKLDWNATDTARLLVAFREDTRDMSHQDRHQLALEMAGEINQAGHWDIGQKRNAAAENLQNRMESQTLTQIHDVVHNSASNHLRDMESQLAQAISALDPRGMEEAIEQMGRAEKDLKSSTLENGMSYGLETMAQVEKLQEERLGAIQETFVQKANENGAQGLDPERGLAEQLQGSHGLQQQFATFLKEIDQEDAQQVVRHTTRQMNRAGGSGWDTEINIRHMMAEAA